MARNLPFYLAIAVVMAAFLLCTAAKPSEEPVDKSIATAWLTQADEALSADISSARDTLKKLHQHVNQLTAMQHWHLQLLDAKLMVYEGGYAPAEPILQDIMDHSGDTTFIVRAMAVLIRDKFLNRDYVSAYAMANALMAELPKVTDPQARLEGMEQVILMLDQNAVGQTDRALDFARRMKVLLPSAKGQCYSSALEIQSLLYAGKLTSIIPSFQAVIDQCLAAGQSQQADALQLDLAYEMVDEGHADQAITLLNNIAPAIERTQYTPYLASLPVTRAYAYLHLDDLTRARKFALDSITITGPDSPLWTLQMAYNVLYQAEKKQGNDAEALAYYEKYTAQKTAAMDNAKAIALAYQTVRQQVQSEKMKADALGKENNILQLRQALAVQAQKSSHLFNVLLLAVIAFFVMAMFWLWLSWRRFRWLAQHDGLTHAYNREHFLAEAGRMLKTMQKAKLDACLIALDLDHFKRVNDTHGHAAGDQVLRAAALIIGRELRSADLFGRLGGEEFGVLMPGCSWEQGLAAANRIRSALAASPVMLDSQVAVTVSASLGLACASNSGYTLRVLLIDADTALYQAKDNGRNQVVVDIPKGSFVLLG